MEEMEGMMFKWLFGWLNADIDVNEKTKSPIKTTEELDNERISEIISDLMELHTEELCTYWGGELTEEVHEYWVTDTLGHTHSVSYAHIISNKIVTDKKVELSYDKIIHKYPKKVVKLKTWRRLNRAIQPYIERRNEIINDRRYNVLHTMDYFNQTLLDVVYKTPHESEEIDYYTIECIEETPAWLSKENINKKEQALLNQSEAT